MKTSHPLAVIVTVSTFAFCLPDANAQNDEASITTSIQTTLAERYPDQKIVHVAPSVFPGLYEIFTGTDIFYTDAKADYIVTGPLVETRSKTDLTATRVDDLNKIDFQSLPFDRAIKVVKGNGSRKLAVFSDPDCPYCKLLEKELADVEDVTVYTFLYPLERIHPQATEKARNIWCSSDRAKTWTQWMLKGTKPKTASCKDNPTADLIALGKQLNVAGTPTLYFSSGKRLVGGRPAKDLSDLLDKFGPSLN